MKETRFTIDELVEKFGWKIVKRDDYSHAILDTGQKQIKYTYGRLYDLPKEKKENGNTNANSTARDRGSDVRVAGHSTNSNNPASAKPRKRGKNNDGKSGKDSE